MAGYVEKRGGGYYLAGSRVLLDSIVHLFREGASPESIRQEFPTLRLEQVYGAIAYYLAHRADVDTAIAENLRTAEEERAKQPPLPAGLRRRLTRARQELAARRS
jgi:uncharacterized protein (DUF433 family)